MRTLPLSLSGLLLATTALTALSTPAWSQTTGGAGGQTGVGQTGAPTSVIGQQADEPEAAQPEVPGVIESRPAAGWSSPSEFLAHPILVDLMARHDLGDAIYALGAVGVTTRIFVLHAEVEYGTAEVVMTSLFEQRDDGAVRLRARRWTIDE